MVDNKNKIKQRKSFSINISKTGLIIRIEAVFAQAQ